MPSRSNLLTKRWSTIELPILPFLAPRVFTPWPSFARRAHTGAQAAQRYVANEVNHDPEVLKSSKGDQLSQKPEFGNLEVAAKGLGRPKHRAESTVDSVSLNSNTWANIGSPYGMNTDSAENSKEPFSRSFSPDDQFSNKYEEIWGTANMYPPQCMDLPAGNDSSKDRILAFEIGEPLGKVQQEVARIVGNTETAKYHESTDQRKNVEQKTLELSLDKPFGSCQEGDQTNRPRRETGRKDYWMSLADRKRTTRGFRRPLLSSMGSCKAPIRHVRWSLGQAANSFSFWQTHFAALTLRLKGVPKLLDITERLTDPAFHESLMDIESSTSLRRAWEALPVEERQDIWPELMILTLDKHPTKALKLLMATYHEPYPSGYAVSDSLDYIISYYLGSQTVRNPKNALDIFRAVKQMLRLGPPGHMILSQKSLYLLLKNLDDVLVGILFQVLMEVGHPLSKHTLMHFPSKLRLSSGSDERINILRKMSDAGSDFNSPEVSSVCATLLQRKNRSSGVSYSDSEIFEFMLNCGMKPNIIIYNILLQNSLEARDHETAWQIHDMMVENGIETDAYTYSLLLTDAKLRSDRASIKRILSIVGERGMQNAHVATDILHTIFIFRQNYEISPHYEEKGRPPKAFERMLTVYRQYFRLEPLTHLIPWFGEMYPSHANSTKFIRTESAPPSNDALMDPAVPTLVVMLTALLREQTEPLPMIQFYNHFCNLVKSGDPIAMALSKSTHVYNIILMALGRFSETLALCPRLIGEMLSQISGAASANIDSQSFIQRKTILGTSHSANQQRLHPKPDVHTWSILLKIFMDHGQPRAAEKVLAMMEERKVWPNQVTWNSLIVGYARMQEMSMTVDAVDRLKKSGFALDGVTMKGLSYFQNRRALVEAMRASEARDPSRSLTKRPSAIGKAFTALNKTVKMVNDGIIEDSLQRQMDVVEDNHNEASSTIHAGEGGEFVIGNITREDDKEIVLDR